MPATSHLSHFVLKINGAIVPDAFMQTVIECTVENSLHLPDMCAIRVDDMQFQWLDSELLGEGKDVEVQGGEEGEPLKTIFNGEITALEMDLAAHGVPTVVVRCLDKSHRLHRGRYSRSYVQMTDADIVQKVGGEAGFQVEADSTSQVHDWVFQNNQTNWEFLQERAARNGYRLYVTGEKALHFKKVKDDGEGNVSLVWGVSLRSFRPRVSASPQVDEVMVRGWDPKMKQAIIGRCTNPAGVPEVGGKKGPDAAKAAFGSARMVVVDRPVHTQGEADDLARSLSDEIGGDYLNAEGLCYAQPGLKPGMTVEIQNIGNRFSGKYFVTSTAHTYTPAEGYATLFSVSGKRPSTLLAMLDGAGPDSGRPARLGGNIVVAIVTDNKDPDGLGRVKVNYPWLAETETSFWARHATPMGGSGRGMYFLPEIDDEVLVAFEHGDIRRPYLIGSLWNGKDKPVEANSAALKDGKVQRRTIKTRIGHTLLFDDTDGKGEVSITTTGQHTLTLDDKNQRIMARTKSRHQVILDDQADTLTVVDKTGQNKITIKSGDNSIAMECMGNFSVKSKGKVHIEGLQGVEVNTPAQVKVEGTAGVDVKSTGMMNLEATGPTSLKSAAIVNVQGALVKIN